MSDPDQDEATRRLNDLMRKLGLPAVGEADAQRKIDDLAPELGLPNIEAPGLCDDDDAEIANDQTEKVLGDRPVTRRRA
jgi:hypothetical protein